MTAPQFSVPATATTPVRTNRLMNLAAGFLVSVSGLVPTAYVLLGM
ncbi:hypothetical protein [Pseudonocardia phyllosphaerae]